MALVIFQIAMDYLVRLDVASSMPIFRDYLIVMNELVEHPDQYYIDCEEAYKQCLWLENRGFKTKSLEVGSQATRSASVAGSFGLFAK